MNPASWPSAKDLELDESQFKALQLALTKEFAVIQGPPGTGKTYIGLKVFTKCLKIQMNRPSRLIYTEWKWKGGLEKSLLAM